MLMEIYSLPEIEKLRRKKQMRLGTVDTKNAPATVKVLSKDNATALEYRFLLYSVPGLSYYLVQEISEFGSSYEWIISGHIVRRRDVMGGYVKDTKGNLFYNRNFSE